MTLKADQSAPTVMAKNHGGDIARKEDRAMLRPAYYPAALHFRVARAVAEAVALEAAKAQSNEAEVCRRMLLAGLQASGVQLAPQTFGGDHG
jgi:hypothetical protein